VVPFGGAVLSEGKEMSLTNFATACRFLLVGMGNTIVGLAVIFAAKGIFELGDVTSNAIGYGTGLVVSFSLNRSWTFRHEGTIMRSLVAFILVQVVAYCSNLACVMGMIAYGVDSYLAQALGIPPYTLISYLGSRYIAFASVSELKIRT
jgi:putative flippase GtrA